MTGVAADVKYAIRLFRKSPGFAAVAIGTLALGISANTVIFSGVEAMLLRPIPAPHAERIVVMRQVIRKTGAIYGVTYPDLLDWRSGAPAFEHVAGMMLGTFNLSGLGDAERIRGARVTSGYFEVFSIPPAAGRIIYDSDDHPGAAPVAVLGYGFAQRRFGGAREAIGRTVQIDGIVRTVVGVMSPAMRYPMGFNEFWIPLAATSATHGRGQHFLTVLARLKPDQRVEEATRQVDTVCRRAEAEFPASNTDMGVRAASLAEQISRGPRKALIVLSAAVGFVLLICCANLANLSLARAVHRTREFAVRQAIGAGRWRLTRQLLAESVTLSLAGGALGIMLASWGLEALSAALPPMMHPMGGLAINGRVLLFTIVLSVGAGALFGLAPALRTLGAHTMEALRDGGRAGAGGAVRSRTSNVLVVTEVALAVTLLGGAALMLAALYRMQGADLGFEPKGLLTAEIAPKAGKANTIDELLVRLNGTPGVRSAAVVNWLPMTSNTHRMYSVDPGKPPVTRPPVADYRVASPRYPETTGVRVVKGRFFIEGDRKNGELVAVVNDRFARIAWPGKDPLGMRVALYTAPDRLGEWRTVVGVLSNVRHGGPAADPNPEIYLPMSQAPESQVHLAIKTAGDPMLFVPALQRIAKSVDPDLPLGLLRSMDRVMADAMTPARFTTALLSIFSGLALLLSAMGLYGVISYLVARRTHEFGVRLALGATASGLLRLVARRAVWLTGTGTVLGLVAAAALTRMLTSLIHGLRPEPLLFALIALVLLGVAGLASWIPLRRALASGPLQALRSE